MREQMISFVPLSGWLDWLDRRDANRSRALRCSLERYRIAVADTKSRLRNILEPADLDAIANAIPLKRLAEAETQAALVDELPELALKAGASDSAFLKLSMLSRAERVAVLDAVELMQRIRFNAGVQSPRKIWD